MNIFDVNWIAVVVAALAGFLVGGIWYGPIMGKTWMGAVGLTEEQIKQGNMGAIYGGAFAFSLVAIGTNYLFSQKKPTLFFIDAGYWLLFYIAMGAVHAWFSQ